MLILSETFDTTPEALPEAAASAPLRVSAPYTPDPDDHELRMARNVLPPRQFAVWYAVERQRLTWFAAQKYLREQGQSMSRATLGRELDRARVTLDLALAEAERQQAEGVPMLKVVVCKGSTVEYQTDQTAQAAHDHLGWSLVKNFGKKADAA